MDERVLDALETRLGSLRGKNILDLGGGPGQYSIAMARRGGIVTWHDISHNYLEMSRRKATEFGVSSQINFSLGYLDEAPRLLTQRFDLVFNRICWNYCFGDASFAEVVYEMVRPGGHAYVDTTHSGFRRAALSTPVRARTWLNDHIGVKIGHPMPPHGRLAGLFLRRRMNWFSLDYSSPDNDRIFFQKAQGR